MWELRVSNNLLARYLEIGHVDLQFANFTIMIAKRPIQTARERLIHSPYIQWDGKQIARI